MPPVGAAHAQTSVRAHYSDGQVWVVWDASDHAPHYPQTFAIFGSDVPITDLSDPGVEQVDNNINFAPRFSPLHTHWIYAGLSATGRLESGGAANTTGPLFGVSELADDVARLAHPGEDAGFRHWRLPFLGGLLGITVWPLIVVWLGGTAAALALAIRSMCASSAQPAVAQ